MIEQIKEHLHSFDYDIRKTRNARFIDQKVTPDVLYIVTNCVLEFTKQNKDLTFSTKDIWESKFANEEVKDIFNKPDVMNSKARSEYDKYFAQPLKMLEYSKVLNLKKQGNRNYFSINNLSLLEFMSYKKRNCLIFIDIYLRKVLTDSNIWHLFESFFNKNTKENFHNLKDGFKEFLYINTKINTTNKHEPGRIFTKIINPMAHVNKSFGTKGGYMSNDVIGYDELMYNRKNWRDISKLKGETRQEYESRAKELIKKRKAAEVRLTIQQAKKQIKKRYNDISEVQDEWANCDATHVHHIFPKSEFPEIESYVENLILLTPNQHLNKAHPKDTKRINKAYQYVCLQSKCNTIQESVEIINDGFYTKEDFSFVLNTGINTENFNENLSFDEIRNQLTEFYHN